ncbi:MAG: hypothetical protein ACK551_02375 [Vampirovibrionales bacterium]
MSTPLRKHAKDTDWYQPLDNSPSAWSMLKHLGLLLWQRLFTSSQKHTISSVVEVNGIKEKSPRRFKTSFKRFPLIKPPSLATYKATLAHLNPYDIAALLEEDTQDFISNTDALEKDPPFVEESSVEVVQAVPCQGAKPTPVSRPTSPKNLDSIDDINTWILLNIDEEIEDEALTLSSEHEEVLPIFNSPAISAPSHQTTTLQQKVEKTQASIDALVNAYFSQTH